MTGADRLAAALAARALLLALESEDYLNKCERMRRGLARMFCTGSPGSGFNAIAINFKTAMTTGISSEKNKP